MFEIMPDHQPKPFFLNVYISMIGLIAHFPGLTTYFEHCTSKFLSCWRWKVTKHTDIFTYMMIKLNITKLGGTKAPENKLPITKGIYHTKQQRKDLIKYFHPYDLILKVMYYANLSYPFTITHITCMKNKRMNHWIPHSSWYKRWNGSVTKWNIFDSLCCGDIDQGWYWLR